MRSVDVWHFLVCCIIQEKIIFWITSIIFLLNKCVSFFSIKKSVYRDRKLCHQVMRNCVSCIMWLRADVCFCDVDLIHCSTYCMICD